jgi:hypothetical protein
MIGLAFSGIVLYAAAGLLGFAAGWRLRGQAASLQMRAAEADIEALQNSVNDARVRRAGGR